MEPLVQWLLAGFVVSLLFIAIARWFWKRYDRPSEEAIEWERQQEEKRKEQEVWESVEMQMRREAEEAEQNRECEIKTQVPPSTDFNIVVTCVDVVVTESGHTNTKVSFKTRRSLAQLDLFLPLDVTVLPY